MFAYSLTELVGDLATHQWKHSETPLGVRISAVRTLRFRVVRTGCPAQSIRKTARGHFTQTVPVLSDQVPTLRERCLNLIAQAKLASASEVLHFRQPACIGDVTSMQLDIHDCTVWIIDVNEAAPPANRVASKCCRQGAAAGRISPWTKERPRARDR